MKKIFIVFFIISLLFFLTGCSPLLNAAAKGDVNKIKLLLDQGADVNDEAYFGYTPLMQASSKGHIEAVKMLLDKGANVNGYCSDGWTALSLAADEGHTDIVKLLLERGADIDKTIKLIQSNRLRKKVIEVIEDVKFASRAPKYKTSPSTPSNALPTALPLPTESAPPF